MTLAAIDLYSISVFIHVTAVVVGFGATFAGPVMFPLAVTLGTRHLPFVHRLSLAISRRLATPALAIVLITAVGFFSSSSSADGCSEGRAAK